MYISLQKPALTTWKRVSNLVNLLWNKLYFPTLASPSLLALTYTPNSLTTASNSSHRTTACVSTATTAASPQNNCRSNYLLKEQEDKVSSGVISE